MLGSFAQDTLRKATAQVLSSPAARTFRESRTRSSTNGFPSASLRAILHGLQHGGVIVMKSIARILLVGAVAVTAIAVSAAPSEAATKKRMKGLAPEPHKGNSA